VEINLTRYFDIIVAGHFAIDHIRIRKTGQTIVSPGGPPTYSAIAARRLGAKVAVLSKVGGDFPKEFLRTAKGEGVEVSFVKWVEDAETTSFYLKYLNEERKLKLKALGPKILPDDVPTGIKAKIVHVAPIANEISTETFLRLKKISEIVCLDPQGYTREFGDEGCVSFKSWRNEEIIGQLSIFKSNCNEVACITGVSDLRLAMKNIADYGVEIVIVTKGVNGATLLFENNFHEIPAYPVSRVDSTGAGDVFIGAFLAEYVREKSPVWCACVGSAAASFIVEGFGPSKFGVKDEIYSRAIELYKATFK
jgi:sugar/nucleoside kinase (ribokinase family)